jgi:hypothetical protein
MVQFISHQGFTWQRNSTDALIFIVIIIIVGIVVFGVGTYTSIDSILADYAVGAVRKYRKRLLHQPCIVSQLSFSLGYPFTCASSAI